ncbi:MAG: hypothetical protein WD825_04595 [Gemmatimonadaceae bacterium]
MNRISGDVASLESSDENATVSIELAQMNEQLAALGANVRIAKAELLLAADGWDAVSSTIVLANDRFRGIGAEWVKGDPRRDGRTGVTYAVGVGRLPRPTVLRAGGSRTVATTAELEAHVEEGMDAWRNKSCSNAPITRVPAGDNPDFVDDLVFGAPAAYKQVSDIVESRWLPSVFFTAIFGPAGANIIGVTFSFVFDDANGPTDIDNNQKLDLGLSEIYYNSRFLWSDAAALGVASLGTMDFYSIITHETGHSLGLGHFGKVFITKKDAADGLQLSDVKFAPRAMMNAVYFTGRSELAGTDNSSFCSLWASK